VFFFTVICLRGLWPSNSQPIPSMVDLACSEGGLESGTLKWIVSVNGTWQPVLGVEGKKKINKKVRYHHTHKHTLTFTSKIWYTLLVLLSGTCTCSHKCSNDHLYSSWRLYLLCNCMCVDTVSHYLSIPIPGSCYWIYAYILSYILYRRSYFVGYDTTHAQCCTSPYEQFCS